MPIPAPNVAQENPNQGKPMSSGPVQNWFPTVNPNTIDPGFYQRPPFVPIYVTQPTLPPAMVATPLPTWWDTHKTEVMVTAAMVAALILADILIGD